MPFNNTGLREVAHHIGYEWAMLLGAAESDWHLKKTTEALALPARAPLLVAHLHARTELVWLHARVLYGFLFIPPRDDDLSVIEFLDDEATRRWSVEDGMRAVDLCPTVQEQCGHGGLANKKLFHATDRRRTALDGLPGYDVARDQLRRAFSACYGLMKGAKQAAFREGLDHEWDVSAIALVAPTP